MPNGMAGPCTSLVILLHSLMLSLSVSRLSLNVPPIDLHLGEGLH